MSAWGGIRSPAARACWNGRAVRPPSPIGPGVALNISNNWLCVAGRYGLAAGPAGNFKYQTAASYNILGAAQDTLQFLPSNSWGSAAATWFPAKNALQISNSTAQIS